ncbi:hypothetical protein JHK85_004554 [Glycine max]|nr:hypothetical protein JHK87_004217 [Glycine soja]KAG5063371.1 hypothetical protein JHK85_004554 [Glycine max]
MCMYCKQGPHSNFAGQTSGSTACVTIIRNNYTFVANAGYSRCVICGKGQAYDLSIDHKPDLEIEKERIVKVGGFIHARRVNGSLSLARAIVDLSEEEPCWRCVIGSGMHGARNPEGIAPSRHDYVVVSLLGGRILIFGGFIASLHSTFQITLGLLHMF